VQRPAIFIARLLWAELLFMGVLAGAAVAVRATPLGAGAAVLASLVVLTLGARRLARRGKVAAAMSLVAYGILGHGLAEVYLVPFLEAAVAVALLIAVLAVLPYRRERPWRVFLIIVVVGTAATPALAFWSPFADAVPRGTRHLLSATGLGTASLLVVVAIADFSARLRRAVEAEAQARAAAEESAALLDTLFTSAPVGLSFLDRDLRYVRINRALAQMNGVPPEDHIGRRPEEIVPELAAGVQAAHQTAMERNCTVMAEISGTTAAAPQQRRDWLVSYYPVRVADRLLGTGAVVLDLTDRKRAYAAAQQAVKLRDDFISVASHELKTPLTSLRLQVDGCLRHLARDGTLSRERVIKLAGDLDRGVARLDRLVDDLLDFSRLASGRLDLRLELVDWASLIAEVVDRFSPHLEEARCPLNLHLDRPLVGSWDRLRLEQITTNLVSNAIKYGPGAPVEVALNAEGPSAVLRVRDHGIGIAAADQTRIFERFERAVSSRSYGGFGLGLWIVRRVADAFGGAVAVDSAPGAGATFTVTLPREPPPERRASPGPS